MQKRNKIVLFTGDVETLGFFSQQIQHAFDKMGYETLLYDFLAPQFDKLNQFVGEGDTYLLTYNYIGILEEEEFIEEDGQRLWDKRNVRCINLVVDHPFYYHKHMKIRPMNYVQYNVDRLHVDYVRRFFPGIRCGFLPLAGTKLPGPTLPWEERDMDVLFTGNYTPPCKFERHIKRINDEYTAFYYGIINELIKHPQRGIDEVVEEHTKREIPEITESELADVMENIIFIDLYVRFYFRGLVVKTLLEAGIQVYCVGSGWDLLACDRMDCMVNLGPSDSEGCLQYLQRAKLALNVMPWFKQGAHDRIFNALLQHSLPVSDTSGYLSEIFEDGKDIAFYSLNHIDLLPNRVKQLLQNSEKTKIMIGKGYGEVSSGHKWENRAA